MGTGFLPGRFGKLEITWTRCLAPWGKGVALTMDQTPLLSPHAGCWPEAWVPLAYDSRVYSPFPCLQGGSSGERKFNSWGTRGLSLFLCVGWTTSRTSLTLCFCLYARGCGENQIRFYI